MYKYTWIYRDSLRKIWSVSTTFLNLNDEKYFPYRFYLVFYKGTLRFKSFCNLNSITKFINQSCFILIQTKTIYWYLMQKKFSTYIIQ